MKKQYSIYFEYIVAVSMLMYLISSIIGVINSFSNFLSPYPYNLVVGTSVLSLIGFATSDLYSILYPNNKKTTLTKSVLKKVFYSVVFFLCAIGFSLFLFFGFFDYNEQSFTLSIVFSGGASIFAHKRLTSNIIDNTNKNIKSKIKTGTPIDLSFWLKPMIMYSILYFSIAFLIITLINKYIVPLSPHTSPVVCFAGVFYGVILGDDLRQKSYLVPVGGIITYIFLFLSKIIA